MSCSRWLKNIKITEQSVLPVSLKWSIILIIGVKPVPPAMSNRVFTFSKKSKLNVPAEHPIWRLKLVFSLTVPFCSVEVNGTECRSGVNSPLGYILIRNWICSFLVSFSGFELNKEALIGV